MNTSKETVKAERAILAEFRHRFPNHVPWTGAVLIRFTAVFETPKSFNRALREAAKAGKLHCIKKPDKDNIEKLIVDALSPPKRRPNQEFAPSAAGYAWVDDAQVMGGGIKRYGSPARIDVTLELLETGDAPPTPGERRAVARLAQDDSRPPQRRLRATPTKSVSKKAPTALQRAIDAALARDAGKKD